MKKAKSERDDVVRELATMISWMRLDKDGESARAPAVRHASLIYNDDFFSNATYVSLRKEALSSPFVYDALCSAIGFRLMCDLELSRETKRFIARVMMGAVPRPIGKQGPYPGKNNIRDIKIVILVRKAIQRGFKATRGKASKHQNSACDIVAEAINSASKRQIKYETVAAIWAEKKNLLPS